MGDWADGMASAFDADLDDGLWKHERIKLADMLRRVRREAILEARKAVVSVEPNPDGEGEGWIFQCVDAVDKLLSSDGGTGI